MSDDQPYRLHQSLAYHLSIAARQHERWLDDQLRTLGLSRTTWCILLAIGNEQLHQPSDIASFVGIDRTATSRALRQMEAQGLLARRSGTKDKRTRMVELTEDGHDAIKRATPFARQNAQSLSRILDKKEEAELARLLNKLRDADDAPLKAL